MKTSFYKMVNNKYLGNCFAIVVVTDTIPEGFTAPEITLYIKTSEDVYNSINSLEDLKNTNLFSGGTPYLRIGSECMLGVFGDSHCNCEEERIASLTQIAKKYGIYIHLKQEAQGMGIHYKLMELNLQVHGIMPDGSYVGPQNQAQAAKLLTGHEIIDKRSFDFLGNIMSALNLEDYEYVFMSRNPNKVKALKSAGIKISAMYDINTKMTPDNIAEYLTKWIDKGYCFTLDEVEQVIACIESEDCLPFRAVSLLEKAAYMLTSTSGTDFLRHHLYVTKECEQKLFRIILDNYSVKQIA